MNKKKLFSAVVIAALLAIPAVAQASVNLSYDGTKATGSVSTGTRKVTATTKFTKGAWTGYYVTAYAECRNNAGNKVGASGWDDGGSWAQCTAADGNATNYGTVHAITPSDDTSDTKDYDYINGSF